MLICPYKTSLPFQPVQALSNLYIDRGFLNSVLLCEFPCCIIRFRSDALCSHLVLFIACSVMPFLPTSEKLLLNLAPAMDQSKPSSVCSEETSSWHSAFEPTTDKPKSSSTTVGDFKSKSRKRAKPKAVGKSRGKKDIKKHKKSSKRKKKKKRPHSSSQSDSSPISSSELLEGSGTDSPNLGDPMQFHRPLPFGKACAKMLVRARYRCACHFLLLSQCPSGR